MEDSKPSLWSADRLRAENPRFQTDGSEAEIYFTGEMVSAPSTVGLLRSNKFQQYPGL